MIISTFRRLNSWCPVAVRCSALQCVAVCCSVLQCAAVYCSVLQCVTACDNVCINRAPRLSAGFALYYSALQTEIIISRMFFVTTKFILDHSGNC